MWADVHIFSDGLTDEQIERSLLIPSASIEQTVSALQKQLCTPIKDLRFARRATKRWPS